MKRIVWFSLTTILILLTIGCNNNNDKIQLTETDSSVTNTSTELSVETTTEEATVSTTEITTEAETETTTEPAVTNDLKPISLGIPLANYYKTSGSYARTTNDLICYDGRIYVGGGDQENNLGPVPSYAYDESTGKWICVDKGFPEEKIRRFHILDGKLVTGGTDSREDWSLGNYFVLEQGKWVKYRNINAGAHVYDLITYNNQWFVGIGSTPSATHSVYPVLRSLDGGKTFQHVDFYKKGALLDIINFPCARVYNLVQYNNVLYAFLYAYNSDQTINTFEVYSYDQETNTFYYKSSASYFRKQGTIYEPKDFLELFQYGDYLLIMNEFGLHMTNDLKSYSKVDVCGAKYVKDMYIKDGTLYVLANDKNEDGTYTNYICTSTNGTDYNILLKFQTSIAAACFTTGNNGYYFGMGDRTFHGHKELGAVYFLEY